MSKLHELLAVKDNLRSQAEATRSELKNTFEKKGNHFIEKLVTFKPIAADQEARTESQLGMQTTIAKELDWISEKIGKAIDVAYQVDIANLTAKADVVPEDSTTALLTNVPATALLQLEHTIAEIMELVKAIPTLDPSKGFEPDKERGAGIFQARDVIGKRTEKQFSYVVMVQPTDKHPAQVKELSLDKSIGEVLTQEWCSFITVADKGDMLDRVEKLARAIKAARSRANNSEVNPKDNKIGQTLLDYVFKGK